MWQHKRRRKGERRPYRARHTALHSCSRKQFSNFYNLLSPTIISELWPNKSTVKARFWNTFAVDRIFYYIDELDFGIPKLFAKNFTFSQRIWHFPPIFAVFGLLFHYQYWFLVKTCLKFYFGFGIFPSQRVFTEHLLLQVFLFYNDWQQSSGFLDSSSYSLLIIEKKNIKIFYVNKSTGACAEVKRSLLSE